jgi:hypothetical protein
MANGDHCREEGGTVRDDLHLDPGRPDRLVAQPYDRIEAPEMRAEVVDEGRLLVPRADPVCALMLCR